MRFRTAPCLLVVTLGLFGCDDRYLVGFGPDGGGGSAGPGAGGSGAGAGGSIVAGATGGGVGGSGGSAAGGTGSGGEGGAAAGGAGGSQIGGSGGYSGSTGGSSIGTGGMIAGAGGSAAGAGGSAAGAAGSSGPPVQACTNSPAPLPVQPLGISTDHVAERLARVLWGERPDASTLARTATLRTSADVQVLARTMLQDPRAEANAKALMRRWLKLDEIGSRLDQSALSAGLRREADAFATRMLLFEGASLLNLLTASFTFTDSQEVATFYGAGNVVPLGLSKIIPDPAQQRSGILTQGGLLRAYPRASTRGQWLRAALLCQPVPVPPSFEPPPPPTSTAPSTYRQRLTKAIDDGPACQACHGLIDPPGFTLEHYDDAGRWRATDDGLPVDAAVSLELDGAPVTMNGARSLGESLARSCGVQACAVRNFLEFAVGPLRPADELSLTELQGAFAQSGFNLKELLIAVTGSKAFLAP